MSRPAIALSALLAWAVTARAGLNVGELIVRSEQQEAAASHIVVGRLREYREESPGRFVAVIQAAGVEKGSGIGRGDILFVRFRSHRTLEYLRTDRILSDCGDRKIDPLPGEYARVYLLLDAERGYVADHPEGFFMILKSDAIVHPASMAKDVAYPTAVTLSLGSLLGVLTYRRRGLRKPASTAGLD